MEDLMKTALWVAAVGSVALLVGFGMSQAAAGVATGAGVGALGGPPGNVAATQVTAIVQETVDARFPVFFLPKSSVLSRSADDIIARLARTAGSGTIILVQASSDHEAGETTQTAAERSDAVRLELIRDGIPAPAIRIMHAGVSVTGIESRSVIISVIRAAPSSPPVATGGAAPAAAL
jgi:hypothetical protein